MLAGVAKGLADNFGIVPWIPRVVFLITAFMGGLGIALYAAGWAFIRSEDEAESPAERWFSGAAGTRSWVGIALIVLAGVVVLDSFTILSGEVIWAAALLVVGLLLYMGYLPPRSEAATSPGGADGQDRPESKEGVQQMTTGTTVTENHGIAGDSPAGEQAPPPARTTPTPPALPPTEPRERSILGRVTIGLILLGMGALAILDNIPTLAIDADPRHYLALAVTILGVGLLVGSVYGKARWLILLGALLIPTLLFSPAFEYDWNEEAFDHTVVPTTFEDLDSSYSIDVGAMTIDLRNLDWEGETVELAANVDVGNLEIRVPDGVAIQGHASVDVGRVAGPGDESFGFGDPSVSFDTAGDLGVLILDAEVNAGNIDVRYFDR